MTNKKFTLSDNFVSKYVRRKPPFGFNGLGELVYMRTYSRIKDNGKTFTSQTLVLHLSSKTNKIVTNIIEK